MIQWNAESRVGYLDENFTNGGRRKGNFLFARNAQRRNIRRADEIL